MPLDNDQLNEKIHNLDLDVEVLKKDSEIQSKILDKLDRTVEGIHDLAQSMNRMVSIHEEKFTTQTQTNARLDSLIEERRAEMKEAIAEVITKIEFIAASVEDLKLHLIKKKEEAEPRHERTGAYSVVDFMVHNWKIMAFGFAFAAGIVTHKWNLLESLFGSS